MYILIIAIVVLWMWSVFAFARWRFHSVLQKRAVLSSVLGDQVTNLYVRGTAVIILLLIFYIIG